MTLKKLNQLLEEAKEYAFKNVEKDPREKDYAISYFDGYFMSSLFREIFKSKNDFLNKKGCEAFDKWSKTTNDINSLKFKEEFLDIIKQFLNRR